MTLLPALRRLLRQGLGFTAVGGLQLVLDWAVMVALSALGLNLELANVLGRAAGASLGFWGNGRLTFAGGRDPWRRQALRFLILWAVLTTLSTLGVGLMAAYQGAVGAWLMKPVIEAVLSLISFFTCRHWVYR
jgi:putative flippase GtrA